MKPKRVPDFVALGDADRMGPELRALVESQLVGDLQKYGVRGDGFRFDWSEACIEGHLTELIDGSVENFSGIMVYDLENNLIADGWMEFIHEGDFFQAYWEFVRTWQGDQKLKEKKEVGIPAHIWKLVPETARSKYKAERL